MSQYYDVDAIKDVKKVGNVTMYLVKWEGLPESANSWEPEKNLRRCEKLLREFEKKQISEKRYEANEKRNNRAKFREERTRLTLAHAEVCPHCARSDATKQTRCHRNAQIQSIIQDLNRSLGPDNVIKQYHGVDRTRSGELFLVASVKDGRKLRLHSRRLDELHRQQHQLRGAQ